MIIEITNNSKNRLFLSLEKRCWNELVARDMEGSKAKVSVHYAV